VELREVVRRQRTVRGSEAALDPTSGGRPVARTALRGRRRASPRHRAAPELPRWLRAGHDVIGVGQGIAAVLERA